MRPVLFDIFGFPINSYGVSKALAALVAAFAFVLAGLLWWLRQRIAPLAVFGLCAVFSGIARFLVEEIRINKDVLAGMPQPQLWSLVLVAMGAYLLIPRRCQGGDGAAPVPDVDDLPRDPSVDNIESVNSPSATR